MPYELAFSLALGSGKSGLTDLRAQIIDVDGADVGTAISTGFSEIGSGNYLWHYTGIPDGHRGGVKFYSQAQPSVVLCFISINSEELQIPDVVSAQLTLDHGEGSWETATGFAEPGSEMSLVDGAISNSKFDLPSEGAGQPVGFLGYLLWAVRRLGLRRVTNDKVEKTLTTYLSDGVTPATVQSYVSDSQVDDIQGVGN